ncbi:hypothetical protein H5T87_05600 [bacterium]|nr:hypothetical protein [bacterium]
MSIYNSININGIAPLLWLEGESNPIVLSSRVRIARNIESISFPHWADKENLNKVVQIVEKAWQKENFPFLLFFPLSSLTPSEKNLFAETHLISREFARVENEGRALLISPDSSLSVMLNEEDHIRISALGKGNELERIMKKAYKLEKYWREEMKFAYSPFLGFLTASPNNIGSGLRLSYVVHLPALTLSRGRKFVEGILCPDIEVRGLFGEGSEPLGYFYQIANRRTFRISEEILSSMTKVISLLQEKELEERERILRNSNIIEKIEEAYAHLCSSVSLSTYSAIQLLSLIRLASAQRIIPISLEVIDILLFLIRPTVLQFYLGKKLKIRERDRERANLIKGFLKER